LSGRHPSSTSRSRAFAIMCRGFRGHSRRYARFSTISVYLLSRSSRAKRCTNPNSSYGSGGVTGTGHQFAVCGSGSIPRRWQSEAFYARAR
jgi:hypothetical protein